MAFDGYLLYVKIGNSYTAFPNEYIDPKTYNSTPNQRLEIKAVRNSSTAYLNRTTAPNTKTSLSFSTHPLHLNEMSKVRGIFNRAFTSRLQRRLKIKYWNDETMDYREATAYMPDTVYTFIDIDSSSKDILYGPATFEFIEY